MSPLERYRRLPSPLLVGHRGLNTVAPENTLEAIAAAADQGARGVEIDVRPTRDGQIRVFHDPSLERLAGRPDVVAERTAAELSTVDLGGGARIPSLTDVLALCRERELFLNVELKRDVPDRLFLCREVARILTASELPALALSSFDPFILAVMRQWAPELPIAMLYTTSHRYLGLCAGPLGAVAAHPDQKLVTPREVASHQRAGRRVMTWTVNDPARAR